MRDYVFISIKLLNFLMKQFSWWLTFSFFIFLESLIFHFFMHFLFSHYQILNSINLGFFHPNSNQHEHSSFFCSFKFHSQGLCWFLIFYCVGSIFLLRFSYWWGLICRHRESFQFGTNSLAVHQFWFLIYNC